MMHVISSALQLSGDNTAAASTFSASVIAAVICMYAGRELRKEDLLRLRSQVPAGARIVSAGLCAPDFPVYETDRIPNVGAGTSTVAILAAAAKAFPGAHLILVDADAALPEWTCERLLRALGEVDVLGAMPLDAGRRDPLPPITAVRPSAERLDALCFAYSEKQIHEDPFFPEAMGAISAWHGTRLAQLGPERLCDVDAIAAQGLRVVMLDHLYVEAPASTAAISTCNPLDPKPPSILDTLRERLATAVLGDFVPICAGLDNKPVLLHILHGWGGGAERWVRDFSAADPCANHLVLLARGSPHRRRHGEWLELHDAGLDGPPLRRWPLPRAIADTVITDVTYRELIGAVVREYCVDAIIVSSLIGHSLDVLRSGLPTYYIVHDHYPLWPVLHRDFGDPTLRFDSEQRALDLAATADESEFANHNPQHWQLLRDATVDALQFARATLIAPSHSALANQLRLAPELGDLPTHVVPHALAPWPSDVPKVPLPPQRERLRLVVPGRIRRGKGADLLAAALPRLHEYADLFLLGAGADAHAMFGKSGVHIVLDYRRDELPQLLAKMQPDAALLLPTVAETFSYTLSELRSLGIPVIATRVGALAERITDGTDGFLVEPNANALVARIAALGRNPAALDAIRSNSAIVSSAPLEMVASYSAIMQLPERKAVRYPLIKAHLGSLQAMVSANDLLATRELERTLRLDLKTAHTESVRRGEWGHALRRELTLAGNKLATASNKLTALQDEYDRELTIARTKLTALQDEYDRELTIARTKLTALQDEYDRELGIARTNHTALQAEYDRELTIARTKLARLQDEYDRELGIARIKLVALQDDYDRKLTITHAELTALQNEYDRDLATAQKLLTAVHGELEERTHWALKLDAEVSQQRDAIEQFETLAETLARDREALLSSRSWRATAPLRKVTTRLRAIRIAMAFRKARLFSTWRRVRGSLARRGLLGTFRRIGDEFQGRHLPLPPPTTLEPDSGRDVDVRTFELPSVAQPRVSIVIPVFNEVDYTVACLRSLAEHAGAIPFEVIVVDDGSSDTTAQCLADIAGIRSIRNPHNLGFIGSCNAGAVQARGDYLLFLNNDTVVTAGWLDALVRCLEDAPDAGLVGAKLVYPDGRLQEAGGIVFNDGSGWNYGRFDDPGDSRYGFRREVDYCSGAAILLRRKLFEQLGRFDVRYTPAYYEDTDLAFAVRAAGLKVYYEPAATVVHFEGVSSGTDTSSGVKRYQVINREKFLDKWKDALSCQPAPGMSITQAATHRASKRVLIVDATTPTPDQDSGSLRMVNLMRVLIDLGCQVSFLPDNRAWFERYTPALQELGVEALYAPYAQDPVKFLRERGCEFDLIVLSRHYVAASYVGLVRLYAPQAKLAFDTVDLHYLREQRAAELEGSADLASVAEVTRAQELKVIGESDLTLVVSPAEKELLARDAPGQRVEVLSNVHEVHGCKASYAQRRDLVFVGGFQHPPNTDAVEWFVADVFPLIRAELPELCFHVVGSKMTDAIRSLADEHVIVHGFVEDILPFMDGCRVSVAPLRYGAGVKGKVNMAMSCGLPVVATPIAVEGMHVDVGTDVLVGEHAAAFAAAVVHLYRDEALWNTLSVHGLANVERYFSFATARSAVRRILG